jgi:hypothetical protein
MGKLVTDSKFLTASTYSSRVRSTGPKGSSPFFEKKPWTVHCQDSNMGQDAHSARALGYWPLADSSLTTPHFKVPWGSCEPIVGRRSIFSSVSLLTSGGSWPIGAGRTVRPAHPSRERLRFCAHASRRGMMMRRGRCVDRGGWFASRFTFPYI